MLVKISIQTMFCKFILPSGQTASHWVWVPFLWICIIHNWQFEWEIPPFAIHYSPQHKETWFRQGSSALRRKQPTTLLIQYPHTEYICPVSLCVLDSTKNWKSLDRPYAEKWAVPLVQQLHLQYQVCLGTGYGYSSFIITPNCLSALPPSVTKEYVVPIGALQV